jgi:hypothetical protein
MVFIAIAISYKHRLTYIGIHYDVYYVVFSLLKVCAVHVSSPLQNLIARPAQTLNSRHEEITDAK